MTLVEQLMRDEGFVGHVYSDSIGLWTIGFGRLVDVRRGGGISREEGEILLRNDVARTTHSLEAAIPWLDTLDDARRGVLINMAFNLGVAGLLGFRKFMAAMEAGDFEAAAVEMMDSRWAVQVGARAERLRDQVITGEWV